ncbi:MAG: DNA polymerase II [Pseudomonadales bacterium]|jgi:DNA polymerase-2
MAAVDTTGFILQATYRVSERVPVVHLFGRLRTGESFLVRDRRSTPHFYVPRSSEAAAMEAGAQAVRPVAERTFTGAPVSRVEVGVPQDAPHVRDALHARGIPTFEADVRFAVRYLIDRGIKGGCRIRGEARPGQGVDVCFDDPELEPADVSAPLRTLSFDIETDPKAQHLLAISLYAEPVDGHPGLDEVLVVDPEGRPMPDRALGYADERQALQAFCERIRRFDPDVLTGWNVIDFDLSVLARVAARVRHPFVLGRAPGALRIRAAEGYFGSGQASIPGRLVLDGMDLVRGAFLRFDDMSLDGVSREVLGEGKALEGDVADRAAEIMERYREDLAGFAHYARTDARLALDVVNRLNLVDLAVARSQLTGMTPDRVAASIASFDFLYLAELKPRGVVAPSVGSSDSRVHVAQAGGHVFEPVIGVHENVWVFDFKSLYPSLMRTFNIDPLGYVAPEDFDKVPEAIELDSGARFRREPGILPGLLDRLFPRREAAKRAGDQVASQAIKILMNSFYGVLGTPACRFHNPAIANAITGQGRHFLQWTRDWFESRGHPVLYGDTDSLFVGSGMTDVVEAQARGAALAGELTRAVAAYIDSRWRVTSRMELEFEKLYVKLFLPSVRHGAGGARKRYAGLRVGSPPEAVEFVGMEVVRRDWTELAKIVQRELYARLFAGEPVDDYLADVVAKVRSGEMDEHLIYRKGLRKSLASYTANTPPHVIAARRLVERTGEKPPRVIAYRMTATGPEPVDAQRQEPDREHYVEKQVRPVAEPVLAALGLDFARVIGDDRQMGLF